MTTPPGSAVRRPVTVIVPLPPSYRGGTEEYAYRLAARFARVLPVRILTTTVRGTSGTNPVDVGEIPVEKLDAVELFERPLVWRSALRRKIREYVQSSSLVQMHMPFPFVERRVAQWAREAGVPTVLTYHMDADFGGASGIPGGGAVTGAYRRASAFGALEACDLVVSNSLGYARASPVLSRFLPKVRVVFKGVDPVRLRLPPRGSPRAKRLEPGAGLLPDSNPDERRVLFVGRLVAYKGIGVLLDAVARLRPEIPGLVLYIAGKGPMLRSLKAKVDRLDLGRSVRFLGFVPDETVGDLYRSVDVVACPSLSLMESTATALEEAAACGTPTVGSWLPGADESLPVDGIHGLLVESRNVEALSQALQRILGQPRPAGSLEYRTWDDTAEEYLRFFQELGVGPGTLGGARPPA